MNGSPADRMFSPLKVGPTERKQKVWRRQFGLTRVFLAAPLIPCHIHLPVCLWIMDPHSRAAEENASHGNEVLRQETTHLIQRPCYQWKRLCQDPASNRTTRRHPDHRKETQAEVVWTSLPFIRSGHNHLARHSERSKKARHTEKQVGRQHQLIDRPGVRKVQEEKRENRRKWLWSHLWCSNNPRG